jgi:hypothetical protein
MRRIVPSILCLSLVFAGCRAKEAFDKVQIAKELGKSGSTIDLMKDVSKDKYNSPADGKLTEAQVQMYLKVRDRERQIAQVAREKLKQESADAKKAGDNSLAGMIAGVKSIGTAGDFLTADIRAAKDLGYNTQEYMWVKSQILAASTSAMSQQINQTMSAQLDASLAQMKKAMDESKDETTKKAYADSLAQMEKSRTEMATTKEDPALTYNRQLLSKHEAAMNAFANEMAKYEDKDGDAKKNMDQWQHEMTKATADAKATAAKP